ncbi:hypothetical protein BY996DRAFT_6414946 [Phakopsora pachyrhizi]|nr:hypothetical protein BY996DRAFT_6414946 [Phakopsora pachyrhizi]
MLLLIRHSVVLSAALKLQKIQLKTSSEQHAPLVYLIYNITHKVDKLAESILVSQSTGFSEDQSDAHHLFICAHKFVWTKTLKSSDWKLFVLLGNDLKNITVQSGNPEQPIPRLIELAKMLLEWAAPKGVSSRNKEVKDRVKDKKIQCQFSLLCVCATYQHTHNNKACWPKIYEDLEFFLKKNVPIPKFVRFLTVNRNK